MFGGNRELATARVLLPQAPVLVAGFREVLWLSPDGEIEVLASAEACRRVERETPMLCHSRATPRRLDVPIFPAPDLLELFAFVRPATFCVPTPRALAAALCLRVPPVLATRDDPAQPPAVLAEAGKGVGKPLGYIAAASLWAEKNRGSVWISTFTRNLQTQIAGELDRLYPDPDLKQRRVVVRKGRENFLCLLNYEEAVGAAMTRPGRPAGQLGLIARWIVASEAGDIVAGDLPGWLAELIGRGRVNWLADRRGECVHSACPHFRRCFVQKNIRKARHALIVVANHALVMAQAALRRLHQATVATRHECV